MEDVSSVYLLAALCVALVILVSRRRYRLFKVRMLQTDRFEARRVATRLYLQRAVFLALAFVSCVLLLAWSFVSR